MTDEQAREIFNNAAKKAAEKDDKDAVAKIELIREYLTNPQFRESLSNYLWTNRK